MMPGWWNWQTHRLEGAAPERACEFKSRSGHSSYSTKRAQFSMRATLQGTEEFFVPFLFQSGTSYASMGKISNASQPRSREDFRLLLIGKVGESVCDGPTGTPT